ncbi:MAG: matrixin family metalloprotease [Candidatus Levybacteria bacterium]|nr:matrixin family metalloprotease [Candidatus Levybacteria bacterium]
MRNLLVAFLGICLLAVSAPVVFAQKPDEFLGLQSEVSQAPMPSTATEPPDVSGDYPVPGKKHLRLRVIAHPERPRRNHRKPTPIPLPACTPDNDSSTQVKLTGWHLKPGQTMYRVNYATVPSSVGSTLARTALVNAFSTWDASVSATFFTEGPTSSASRARLDGQNAVLWRRQSLSTLAIAYTWYSPVTKETIETDIVFNARQKWSFTPYSSACSGLESYDVQNIATHEIGHWMGLDDMYSASDWDLTMYGYGSIGELKKDTLTAGDISSVTALYSSL